MTQAQADVGERILVAQTPDEYAWVVLVAADGRLCTLMELSVERSVREMLIAIAERNLVYDVETERVSQLVETWFARIVRGADVVDGCGFHEAHVLQREAVADDFDGAWISGMGCDAAEFDGLTIELQDLAVNADFADAKTVAEVLQLLALADEACVEGIEIGRFGGPEVGAVDVQMSLRPLSFEP